MMHFQLKATLFVSFAILVVITVQGLPIIFVQFVTNKLIIIELIPQFPINVCVIKGIMMIILICSV